MSRKEIILLIINIPLCILLGFLSLLILSIGHKGEVFFSFGKVLIGCSLIVAVATLLIFKAFKALNTTTALIAIFEIFIIFLIAWKHFENATF
jgi:hypothetical protein